MTSTIAVCALLAVFLLPRDMYSVGFSSDGGPLILETGTPKPELKEGDIMIRVNAAGVNRLDLLQAAGKYPPPAGESTILGVEVAGTITELSPLAAERRTDLTKGDKVMALVGGGGYAEYCRSAYQTVMKVPDGVSMIKAAGIPEVFLTAYQALVLNARMKDGDTVLIHAGASGVGLAAIQLSKTLFKDTTIIATAGSDTKLEVCKRFGAHVAINYKNSDFAAEVLAATNNKGADVVLDFIGASYWEKHMQCTAVDARIVHLGLLGGATVDSVDLRVMLKKRLSLIFSTLRSRSLEYREQLVKDFSEQVLPLFANGSIESPVDSSFPLERAGEAHTRMRENLNIGKIILTV